MHSNTHVVEQRYLYLVHDPRYVNKLRSLIPTSNPSVNSTSTTTFSQNPPSPQQPAPEPVHMVS